MTFFKKVDQVLAALGNIKAMERLHVDTVTEDKIKSIKGKKIAESREGILYATVEHLHGYFFFETTILSKLNIKTYRGAKLEFKGGSDFIINSDTQEIESDFSNISNQFMTKISFDISEADIKKIKAKKYKQVVFTYKKKSLTWLTVA